MGDAGIDGILVTTPVVTPSLLSRIAATREKVASLMVVVDSETGVEPYRPAGTPRHADRRSRRRRHGSRPHRRRPTPRKRCGSLPASPPSPRFATAASRLIMATSSTFPRSTTATGRSPNNGRGCRSSSKRSTAAGYPPEIVSGGGTGTHHLDLAHGPVHRVAAGFLHLHGQAVWRGRDRARRLAIPDGADRGRACRQHGAARSGHRRCRIEGAVDRRRSGAGGGRRRRTARPISSMGDEHGAVRVEGRRPRPNSARSSASSRRIATRPSTSTTTSTSSATGAWSTSGRSRRAATSLNWGST